jgi:alpha-N-arabinofuranosidase
MDGPWQLGHKTADEYGRLAAETARAMRMLNPDLELVLCGSSASTMPTFGDWEEVALGHAYELVDMISAHAYYDPEAMSVESFLGSAVDLDRYLGKVIAIADRVGDRIGSKKRLSLSLDEWNVWYFQRHMEEGPPPGWREAPRISEDNYTVTDAVVVGSLLMTLLRRSDRVGIACLAQLVNSLGVIRTEPGGPAWRQAIYHPFALTAANSVGWVLATTVDGPGYATGEYGEVPVIDAVVTHDAVAGNLSIFAVNRATTSVGKLRVDLGELDGYQVREHVTVADDDLGAANTEREPDRVAPRPGIHVRDGRQICLELAPASWSFARLA